MARGEITLVDLSGRMDPVTIPAVNVEERFNAILDAYKEEICDKHGAFLAIDEREKRMGIE